MEKSIRGNKYGIIPLPTDSGPEAFKPSDGAIRKEREVKKTLGEQHVSLPDVINREDREDPKQHEQQEGMHDSAQAANYQAKSRLPVVEKKQKGSQFMRGKNHNIQPLKDRTVFDLPANQEAIFTPDVTKKLLKNRDQESIRKALDYLRNKEENGVNIRSYSLSGRENNVESVERGTNQTLSCEEQTKYLHAQTQYRRRTPKESACGSQVQQHQKACTCALETGSDASNEHSNEHAPTPPKEDAKRSPQRPKRNVKQSSRGTRAASSCHQNDFHNDLITPEKHKEIQREITIKEKEEAQLLRDLKAKLESNGTTSEEETQLKATATSDQEKKPMTKPGRSRRMYQTQKQPQQQLKERTTRHSDALQVQQQLQQMQRPSQYEKPQLCTEGQTEDLNHLPSPPKEKATQHPGRYKVRRRRQSNRNQKSSQPDCFAVMLVLEQSQSSDFNFSINVNSGRPLEIVGEISAND